MQKQKFLVGTGMRLFPISAENPAEAIATLKQEIAYRGALVPFCAHFNPDSLAYLDETEPERAELNRLDIGISLVTALSEGRLNFIVFDEKRSKILAGELAGEYQEPATRELADTLPAIVPPALWMDLPRS
jgi:hypothetical protein